MDEYTEAEELGSEAEDEGDQLVPEGDTVPRAQYEKAVRREKEAKAELRRAKLTGAYGEDIVGLIPPELPADKWESYAEQLKTFRSQPSPTQESESTEGSAPAPVEPVLSEAEQRIAALSRPRDAAASTERSLTWADYKNMMSDPATRQEAMRLRVRGAVDESTYPGP